VAIGGVRPNDFQFISSCIEMEAKLNFTVRRPTER